MRQLLEWNQIKSVGGGFGCNPQLPAVLIEVNAPLHLLITRKIVFSHKLTGYEIVKANKIPMPNLVVEWVLIASHAATDGQTLRLR